MPKYVPKHLQLAAVDGVVVKEPRAVLRAYMPDGTIIIPRDWTIVESPDGSCRALADDGETFQLPPRRTD